MDNWERKMLAKEACSQSKLGLSLKRIANNLETTKNRVVGLIAWKTKLPNLVVRRVLNSVADGQTLEQITQKIPKEALRTFVPTGSPSSTASSAISQSITVYVTDLKGGRVSIQTSCSNSIYEDLMSQIKQIEGIPRKLQRLIYGPRQLEPEKSLADYGIHDKSTIHLILRLPGCKEGITLH
mmetsp:Transcript_29037/g.51954  ORF Transcript_29037/g.51954 Transcript_29037/m.51954 type:complete len:182 (-) Transcript_29037:34-579(-)